MNIDNAKSQMRKGMLEYCVLLLLRQRPAYASDIIHRLKDADLLVVEGTICSGRLNRFILSRTQPVDGQAENVELVTGAKVSVRGSDGSEYVAQQDDGC